MRIRRLLVTVVAGLAVGGFAGRALANPTYNTAGQTPLPVVVPIPAAFQLPCALGVLGVAGAPGVVNITSVCAGRDDTSPWAGFLTANLAVGGAGIPPGIIAMGAAFFTYRPLFDPLLPNPAGASNTGFAAQIAAAQFANSLFLGMRNAVAAAVAGQPGTIVMYLNPAAVAGPPIGPIAMPFGVPSPLAISNLEFFKFIVFQ